ncbi:hypothetical protein DS891_01380 [Pseudoalteromonas sp. JC28]|uniref:hypothetical protein n=1 Tax=Pseudoalteromonas sp. JC28 TaxID=2267617 RepID=UPI0015741C0E|nr:hypothetical protein [Pseudoalteromonas sp. JC28]NSY32260.1 hypothetical protein [Pseudoalteromonas sp. JC28]
MKWQVKYTLENLNRENEKVCAKHVENDVVEIIADGKPDVLAAIYGGYRVSEDVATEYVRLNPNIDFLCGYRKQCVWEGAAIAYLKERNIGWGNLGTLGSAILDGNANFAEHKVYAFAARLIHQYGIVDNAEREFDRIFLVTLKGGQTLRIGLIPDYEPTADNIRGLWDEFGPVDIAWNINPNGDPCANAITTGKELGCAVLKTEGMKQYLQSL